MSAAVFCVRMTFIRAGVQAAEGKTCYENVTQIRFFSFILLKSVL